jgi:predicted HNH restriction endonuclease
MVNLEVHHKQHRSQTGDDSEQNLVTLCSACHANVHREHDSSELGHAALTVVTLLP